MLQLLVMIGMYSYGPYLQPWFSSTYDISKTLFGAVNFSVISFGFVPGSILAVELEKVRPCIKASTSLVVPSSLTPSS